MYDDSKTALGSSDWGQGQPVGAIRCLEEVGAIRGDVLVLGADQDLHTPAFLAAQGYRVLAACEHRATLEAARRNVSNRGINARYVIADPLRPDLIDRHFDTIIDTGVFDDVPLVRRAHFARSVRSRLTPGGLLHMFCDRQATEIRSDPAVEVLRTVFEPGWWLIRMDAVQRDNVERPRSAWISTFMATESPWQALGDMKLEPGRPDSRLVATG